MHNGILFSQKKKDEILSFAATFKEQKEICYVKTGQKNSACFHLYVRAKDLISNLPELGKSVGKRGRLTGTSMQLDRKKNFQCAVPQ